MSTVSLCMIVRNEGKMLERCLASIVAIADEIIIVDTGSTDRTIEIANKFVDKVHHFVWINDFAAARNYAQSLATCDYILRFDSDCTIQDIDIKKLLEIKNRKFDNADLYNLSYVEQFEEQDNGKIIPLIREELFFFYRRNRFHWQNPIHEQLVLNNLKIKPRISGNNNILVLHHREESGKLWRNQQNLDILKSTVQNEDQNYTRMLFFYARDLYFNLQYDESIEQFQKLLAEQITLEMRDYAVEKIIFALLYSNQKARLVDFHDLLQIKSPRVILTNADVLCLSDPDLAAIQYTKYLQKPFLQSDSSFEYDIERFQIHPYIQLAKIQIHKGKLQAAAQNLQKAKQLTSKTSTIERINTLLTHCI
jgi:glycosyltransferase involved in cell wall biosynthesis